MEDGLNCLSMEDNPNYFQMEDDLKIVVNGRQPIFFFFKQKMTSIIFSFFSKKNLKILGGGRKILKMFF